MFTAPQATSIWDELVSERKREIHRKVDVGDAVPTQSLAAAQQVFTRSQLADWDASARAWLLTADDAKMREQKKLMLILKNIQLPVDNRTNVYESVTSAWMATMTALEKLLKGMPQGVHNGTVLLGLSAWHLYPDIVVFADKPSKVTFGDELMTDAGHLTIGLQSADDDGRNGIYWSLSLAHLRFYGEPVLSSGTTGNDNSRVSFAQLKMVVLGAVMGGWGYDDVDDIPVACQWISQCWEHMERYLAHTNYRNGAVRKFLRCPGGWLQFLVSAAKTLLDRKDPDHEESMMLTRFGQRRGRHFLAPNRGHTTSAPGFDLSQPGAHLGLLKSEEDRISFLRRIASECGLSKLGPGHVLIRYIHLNSLTGQTVFEYATAVPSTLRFTIVPDAQADAKGGAHHVRWISGLDGDSHVSRENHGFRVNNTKQSTVTPVPETPSDKDKVSAPVKDISTAESSNSLHPHLGFYNDKDRATDEAGYIIRNDDLVRFGIERNSDQSGSPKPAPIEESGKLSRCAALAEQGEICYSLLQTLVVDANNTTWGAYEPVGQGFTFTYAHSVDGSNPCTISGEPISFSEVSLELLCGDPATAAMFVKRDHEDTNEVKAARRWKLRLEDMTDVLKEDSFEKYGMPSCHIIRH
jgi:hypothetical protein